VSRSTRNSDLEAVFFPKTYDRQNHLASHLAQLLVTATVVYIQVNLLDMLNLDQAGSSVGIPEWHEGRVSAQVGSEGSHAPLHYLLGCLQSN
jgi:hypothetical protein